MPLGRAVHTTGLEAEAEELMQLAACTLVAAAAELGHGGAKLEPLYLVATTQYRSAKAETAALLATLQQEESAGRTGQGLMGASDLTAGQEPAAALA